MSGIRHIEVGGVTQEIEFGVPLGSGSTVMYSRHVYRLGTISTATSIALVPDANGYAWQYHFFFTAGSAASFTFTDGNSNALTISWAQDFAPAEGETYEVDILYNSGTYNGLYIKK